VTALNPKSIVFFVAFLPQFLDLAKPLLEQMIIFEASFLAVATVNAATYALAASAARTTIRKPSVQRAVNQLGGTAIVAMGLATAAWKRVPA
jgi:threonine/homoserine/homoserine lactone efflux protein